MISNEEYTRLCQRAQFYKKLKYVSDYMLSIAFFTFFSSRIVLVVLSGLYNFDTFLNTNKLSTNTIVYRCIFMVALLLLCISLVIFLLQSILFNHILLKQYDTIHVYDTGSYFSFIKTFINNNIGHNDIIIPVTNTDVLELEKLNTKYVLINIDDTNDLQSIKSSFAILKKSCALKLSSIANNEQTLHLRTKTQFCERHRFFSTIIMICAFIGIVITLFPIIGLALRYLKINLSLRWLNHLDYLSSIIASISFIIFTICTACLILSYFVQPVAIQICSNYTSWLNYNISTSLSDTLMTDLALFSYQLLILNNVKDGFTNCILEFVPETTELSKIKEETSNQDSDFLHSCVDLTQSVHAFEQSDILSCKNAKALILNFNRV